METLSLFVGAMAGSIVVAAVGWHYASQAAQSAMAVINDYREQVADCSDSEHFFFAFVQGEVAHERGKSIGDNPHIENSTEWDGWNDGWMAHWGKRNIDRVKKIEAELAAAKEQLAERFNHA